MIKAVIFDMFETLVTLFVGKTYFSEDIAEDLGFDVKEFKKEWHVSEHERSIGKYSIAEGLALVLKKLGIYSEEKLELIVSKRLQALKDTFDAIPEESINLLKELKKRGLWVYGADAEGVSVDGDVDLSGAAALVIGAEGDGISRLVRENCDVMLSIPMRGDIESLNASVAAGILMYLFMEGRK